VAATIELPLIEAAQRQDALAAGARGAAHRRQLLERGADAGRAVAVDRFGVEHGDGGAAIGAPRALHVDLVGLRVGGRLLGARLRRGEHGERGRARQPREDARPHGASRPMTLATECTQ
jgi:hypothetical protein